VEKLTINKMIDITCYITDCIFNENETCTSSSIIIDDAFYCRTYIEEDKAEEERTT
jgi:hypothetical protein